MRDRRNALNIIRDNLMEGNPRKKRNFEDNITITLM